MASGGGRLAVPLFRQIFEIQDSGTLFVKCSCWMCSETTMKWQCLKVCLKVCTAQALESPPDPSRPSFQILKGLSAPQRSAFHQLQECQRPHGHVADPGAVPDPAAGARLGPPGLLPGLGLHAQVSTGWLKMDSVVAMSHHLTCGMGQSQNIFILSVRSVKSSK